MKAYLYTSCAVRYCIMFVSVSVLRFLPASPESRWRSSGGTNWELTLGTQVQFDPGLPLIGLD